MSKRRKKKYRPRAAIVPMTIKVDIVLSPIEKAIDDIRATGFVDTVNADAVIVHKGNCQYFDMPEALRSVARLHKYLSGIDASHLVRLAKKLEVSMPLMEKDLDGSSAELVFLRSHLVRLTPQEAHDAVLATSRNQSA